MGPRWAADYVIMTPVEIGQKTMGQLADILEAIAPYRNDDFMSDSTYATDRIARLRKRMVGNEHLQYRVGKPDDWTVADMPCSLPQRKAHALRLVCERMPVVIQPDELIVGMRTIFCDDEADYDWHATLPAYWRDEQEHTGYEWRSTTHNVPGFTNPLKYGFGGLAEQSRARLADEPDETKREYLSSFVIVCDAVGTLCNRYADHADKLAGETDDAQRLADLQAIAEVCRHIATAPPRNIHEAMQMHWLIWTVTLLEVGCLVTSGRFDQLMAPYWPTDEAGQARATELLECYIIKGNDQNDLWSGKSLVNNNFMLSGLKRDGTDGTNDVTWAVMDSVAALKLPDPQLAIRLHKDSPPELTRHVARLLREGVSVISIYNDDLFVPSLMGAGFPAEDARDYAVDACQDVNIVDKSIFYLGGNYQLANWLGETLDEATDDMSWREFFDAYQARAAKNIDAQLTCFTNRFNSRPADPCPFLSVMMDDCIAKGLDAANGGLRYRDKGAMLAQPVCTINSLAAIHHVVFVTKSATLSEVRDACKADYVGYEQLRGELQAAPKWGNDDDAVDLIGKEMLDNAAREIIRHRFDDEAGFLSGVHQAHHVATGNGMPATPDGRRSGDPLSVTMAPANGTALHGPTAIMLSLTKLDPMLIQWNSSLTLTFDPASLAGEAGLDRFVALLNAYLAMGGPQLQPNCISADTLRAAQADPEQYQDLVVRVWGYCDRFTALAPEYQQEMIERTAHAV